MLDAGKERSGMLRSFLKGALMLSYACFNYASALVLGFNLTVHLSSKIPLLLSIMMVTAKAKAGETRRAHLGNVCHASFAESHSIDELAVEPGTVDLEAPANYTAGYSFCENGTAALRSAKLWWIWEGFRTIDFATFYIVAIHQATKKTSDVTILGRRNEFAGFYGAQGTAFSDVVVAQQPSEDYPIRRELHTAQAIIRHTFAPLRQFKHTDESSLVEYLQDRALAGDVSLLVWEHYRIPAVALTLISRFNRSYEDARHPVWADDRYDILWQLNLDDVHSIAFRSSSTVI
ncbi:hypothetical protein FOZ60_011922 [Perkinsus olseni]|uniref:Uncharacterized protein n=2 Tax=Perkinsus olseni TaxID=32597 RepID=A0A7J6NCI1_PEROL|nr:hypothetical protein FOZ60_011922 [Perkinsus olseni]